jgi:hypothetical protein
VGKPWNAIVDNLAAQATEQLFRINRAQFTPDIQFAEFMRHVQIPDDDGECWMWRGPATGSGYGVYRLAPGENNTIAAHHFIMLHVGRPRPKGKRGMPKLEIDHLCSTPLCVNPDHLEWVTHRENIKRAVRAKAAQA